MSVSIDSKFLLYDLQLVRTRLEEIVGQNELVTPDALHGVITVLSRMCWEVENAEAVVRLFAEALSSAEAEDGMGAED